MTLPSVGLLNQTTNHLHKRTVEVRMHRRGADITTRQWKASADRKPFMPRRRMAAANNHLHSQAGVRDRSALGNPAQTML